MAHFAKLDDGRIVTEVIVISNEVLNNLSFPESEPIGVEFCKFLYGQDTLWAQTSYNASFRYNFAGIGYEYMPTAGDGSGAFVPAKPYSSWTLNSSTYKWESPVPQPDDGKAYFWDEEAQDWIPVASQQIGA